MTERGGGGDDPLFPTRTGSSLGRSAVEHLLAKYTAAASQACPSLRSKNVTPHVLRHYVDGWVMWPAVMFAVVGGLRGPVPAT
jgi:integrase